MSIRGEGTLSLDLVPLFRFGTVDVYTRYGRSPNGWLLLCSHSPNGSEPQRNVSITAVRGAVRPSKKNGWLRFQSPFIVAVIQEKEHVPRVSSKDLDHPVLLRTLRTVKAIKTDRLCF